MSPRDGRFSIFVNWNGGRGASYYWGESIVRSPSGWVGPDRWKGESREMRFWRAGFTLIELLVVVAIIAILAAILLPVFAQAVHQAKETHCQNNLKNIGLAFEQYRNDWNDFYPVAHNLHNTSGSASGAYEWEPTAYHSTTPWEPYFWEAILPYVKNRDIFKDPLDKGVGESFGTNYDSMYEYWADPNNPSGRSLPHAPWNRPVDETGKSISCSYVWNGALGWVDLYQQWQKGQRNSWRPDSLTNTAYRTRTQSGGGPSPKTQGQIQRPSVRYLCWDTMGFWHRVRRGGFSAGWTVLFTDTHVKWVNYQDFDETGQALQNPLMTWYVPIESDLAP
jgi:prepilin-type N-terminal cleavage/methylation domain-containing protein